MQGQLRTATTSPATALASTSPREGWQELWRGAWVIFRKHLFKFRSNSMEIGGTLAWPILWVATFGIGMERVVNLETLGVMGGAVQSYLAFITPGVIALTALSGAVNSGMTLLEEKIKGVLKEYFVAPIARMSILLASTASGLVKTLLQSMVILIAALLFGTKLTGGPGAMGGALLFLALYVFAFVGFSNGVAIRSRSVGSYHMLLFVLNLPLLFLSNALYPLGTMPLWMRVFAYLNPTTYVVDGLRHTLFSNGELPLAVCLVVLGVFAWLCNWFALRSFQRMLEGD